MSHPIAFDSSIAFASLAQDALGAKQIALLALIAVVTTFLLLSTRRKIREAQNTPRAYARDQYRRLKEEKQAIESAQEVMAEMEQLARHIHGQIDTRYAKLEVLLREADRKLAELKRLSPTATPSGGIDVIVDESTDGVDDDPHRQDEAKSAPAVEVRHAVIHRLADSGMSPSAIAAQEGRTIGEVELILALRKTQRSAAAAAAAE